MEPTSISLTDKLYLFANMIHTCHDLYVSKFDSTNTLITTNAPDSFPLAMTFHFCQNFSSYDYWSKDYKAHFLTYLNLTWIIIPIYEEKSLIVLGPCFMGHFSRSEFLAALSEDTLSVSLKRNIDLTLSSIPIFSATHILEYTKMLYYIVHEEPLDISQINHLNFYNIQSKKQTSSIEQPHFHGTYYAEKQMLENVREGNLNFRKDLAKLFTTGQPGIVSSKDQPLRQIKNLTMAAITIISRAAMEGGLNPEIAYSLADYYFQVVESDSDIFKNPDLIITIVEDFTKRVHASKQNSSLSKEIKDFKDYLHFNCEKDISITESAMQYGYDSEYLIKKFKKEVGISPKEYLKEKRLEKAQFYLQESPLTMKEISQRLCFSSPSYFTKIYKEYFGYLPTRG